MICPKCKAEYRDGFFTCSDCEAELVTELKEQDSVPKRLVGTESMRGAKEVNFYTGDFVEVFQTIDQSDLLAVKLAFDDEEIPNNFSGDLWLGYRPGRLARFFVPSEFKEHALKILRALPFDSKSSTVFDR